MVVAGVGVMADGRRAMSRQAQPRFARWSDRFGLEAGVRWRPIDAPQRHLNPIQQISVRYWSGGHALVASTMVATLATLALAWCSWHAVEAPALRLKRHLRGWVPDGAP